MIPTVKFSVGRLAELYEERGDFQLATGIWEKICQIDPMDGDARTRAQQAATKQVINRGRYEGAESTKGVMADHEVAKRLNIQNSGEVDGPGQSEEADLQRAIRKEPDAHEGYIKLADFYRRSKRLEDAQQMLEKAAEITGGDSSVRELAEDVELELLGKNLRLARENAADDAAREQVRKIAREMLLREMEVLRGRVDRYPGDLKLKFRLGECFMRDRKFAQAIPLFQQSSQDSRLEVKALVSLVSALCRRRNIRLPDDSLKRLCQSSASMNRLRYSRKSTTGWDDCAKLPAMQTPLRITMAKFWRSTTNTKTPCSGLCRADSA